MYLTDFNRLTIPYVTKVKTKVPTLNPNLDCRWPLCPHNLKVESSVTNYLSFLTQACQNQHGKTVSAMPISAFIHLFELPASICLGLWVHFGISK